ncbi:hypothetical protein NQZ68_020971 [Dissostichus eleginoides]|nr:hypothetical protein NQZ68_020971 [Dissostichus eleginoides]
MPNFLIFSLNSHLVSPSDMKHEASRTLTPRQLNCQPKGMLGILAYTSTSTGISHELCACHMCLSRTHKHSTDCESVSYARTQTNGDMATHGSASMSPKEKQQGDTTAKRYTRLWCPLLEVHDILILEQDDSVLWELVS